MPTVTRRDWWLGVAGLVLALLAHAAFPRYDWSPQRGGGEGSAIGMLRLDRWTGQTALVYPTQVLPPPATAARR